MDRPDFVRHWSELEEPDGSHYPGDDELFAINAPLGRKLGLRRIGIHHERLPPGRRTSYPVAFPPGTGIAHTFMNNTPVEVRLLVIGEPTNENRIRYPLNAAYEARIPERWVNPPDRPLGPHDGRPKVETP
jgi:uncharacterized cupin superfamily protein